MSSIGSVGAFRPPPSRPPSFEKLDGNSDGALSLEEFKSGAPKGADSAKSEALFKAIDSDSSGSVSNEESDAFKAETDKARQALQSFLFGLQSSGTEATSETAGSTEEEDIFSQIDADSSGGVSLDEFMEAFSVNGNSASGSKSAERLSKLFEALDSDSDGAISKDEQQAFQQAAQERRGPPPSRIAMDASQAYGSGSQLGAQGGSTAGNYARAA